MPIAKLINTAEKFEIEKYKKPKDRKILTKTHIPFSGSPYMHPYDKTKMILVADPYFSGAFYYEFNKSDIDYVEELPNLVNLNGDVYSIIRIWVKKKSIGVRCTPFLVEDVQR